MRRTIDRPARRRARAALASSAVVLALAGCTTGSAHTIAPRRGSLGASAAVTTTSLLGEPSTTAPPTTIPPGPGTMTGAIATPIGAAQVHSAPSATAPEIPFGTTTSVGAPTTFAVVGPTTGPWIEVLLPDRPNGHLGWVPSDSVKLTQTDLVVHVDLEGRHLQVTKAGQVVLDVPVAVGTEANPTPTGATYVTELIKNTNPNGSYGPYAYGLALHSDTLSEFEGGDGQVGIHGTDEPNLIGQRVSHGCVRLSNASVLQLVALQLPLGVPVFIT